MREIQRRDALVRAARDGDHARGRGCEQAREQQRRQQEVPDVIHTEGQLEA